MLSPGIEPETLGVKGKCTNTTPPLKQCFYSPNPLSKLHLTSFIAEKTALSTFTRSYESVWQTPSLQEAQQWCAYTDPSLSNNSVTSFSRTDPNIHLSGDNDCPLFRNGSPITTAPFFLPLPGGLPGPRRWTIGWGWGTSSIASFPVSAGSAISGSGVEFCLRIWPPFLNGLKPGDGAQRWSLPWYILLSGPQQQKEQTLSLGTL